MEKDAKNQKVPNEDEDMKILENQKLPNEDEEMKIPVIEEKKSVMEIGDDTGEDEADEGSDSDLSDLDSDFDDEVEELERENVTYACRAGIPLPVKSRWGSWKKAFVWLLNRKTSFQVCCFIQSKIQIFFFANDWSDLSCAEINLPQSGICMFKPV